MKSSNTPQFVTIERYSVIEMEDTIRKACSLLADDAKHHAEEAEKKGLSGIAMTEAMGRFLIREEMARTLYDQWNAAVKDYQSMKVAPANN